MGLVRLRIREFATEKAGHLRKFLIVLELATVRSKSMPALPV
jgi:hypothetical protein